MGKQHALKTAKMFRKLEFNNLVISNKKEILRARAQTISKLVNKLRKLNKTQEKTTDNRKFMDLTRKNLECIKELKSMKCMDIMRTLLLHAGKNHNAVLTNGRATPDEIAVAMLGLNKILQPLVAKFQKSLHLSDEIDADWRTAILETSKRRLKLEKTEEKRRKRKELKEQKAQTRNRLEWLKQNKPPNLDNYEAEMMNTAVETPLDIIKPYLPENKEIASSQVKKTIKENKKQNIHQMTEIRKVEAESNRSKPLVKSKKTINKSYKTSELDEERPTHVEDPFFITESGQPYLSTAIVLPSDTNDESEEEVQTLVQKRKRERLDKKQDSNKTSLNNSKKLDLNNISLNNGQKSRSCERNTSCLTKEPRPIITNDRAKKTKFDDDGNVLEKSNVPLSAEVPTSMPAMATEGMHPSWVAKQKLKPKITKFLGKKIKFDD